MRVELPRAPGETTSSRANDPYDLHRDKPAWHPELAKTLLHRALRRGIGDTIPNLIRHRIGARGRQPDDADPAVEIAPPFVQLCEIPLRGDDQHIGAVEEHSAERRGETWK